MSKDLPPILEHVPKPKFKGNKDKLRYWAKEKEKWIEGVGEIPGTLYHKTQEHIIKDRYTGQLLHPICRDVDLLIHQEIASCRKAGEALLIIKGRGVGLSVEMGSLTNYFMKVHPGTTSLLTSEAQAKIATLFSDKVAVVYDNLDEDIKPVQINRNETKSSCFLKTEQLYIDDNGEEQVNSARILCRETSEGPKSANAFSGEGAIFGAYDELFLNKRRQELIRSSTSCYVNANTRETTGFLLCGGTVEDTLGDKELTELKKLITEVQESGRLGTMKARLLFIPFWMGGHMVNGHSNEKTMLEWWEKEAEVLAKMSDTTALRAHKMNNPRTLEDIFDLGGGDRWEEDVAAKIKQQSIIVLSDPPPEERGTLVDLNGMPMFTKEKKGTITVLEHPRPNVDYYLNIDGVATGTNTGAEEGSNVAGTVVKMFDNNDLIYAPVCIYTERPKSIEQSYYMLANQIRYYNQHGGFAGVMAEANAGTADHFSTFLTRNGLDKFIMNKKDLSGKGYVNTKKAFQYVNADVRDWQMRQANMFLRKYIGNIKMIQLLEDMMKSSSENADILDSWLMWFIAAGADFDKRVEKKPPRVRHVRKIVRDANGRTKVEWVIAQ